jgi:hypothetical protein
MLKFDIKALERAYKKMKKKGKTSNSASYKDAIDKIILDPYMKVLTVYDADQLLEKLYPGKYKRKWELPFTLDKKSLYNLYKSNYGGRVPFRKKTVEGNYREWVRYNYVIATKLSGERNQYSCLLRSPFFWKCLYIQDLLDQDSRKTFEEIKWDRRDLEDTDKLRKSDECVVKDLWSVQGYRVLPMPKWVALRMCFRESFAHDVEKKQERWEEKLNGKDLKKAEPMFIRVWKQGYEHHLNRMRSEFSLIKTGYAFWYM